MSNKENALIEIIQNDNTETTYSCIGAREEPGLFLGNIWLNMSPLLLKLLQLYTFRQLSTC